MGTKTSKLLNWLNPISATRRTYEWVMSWASKPSANYALSALAAVEAIFFPIPVDPLLVAMGCAKPKKAIWMAINATIFSVLGGIIGYFVGYLFWEVSSEFFYSYIFPPEKFQLVMDKFNENGFLAIFLASFTPIPYKVFTLAAGVANLSLIPFVTAALIGRGLRYLIIGALLYFYGPPIKAFLDKYLEKLSIAFGVIIVLGFVIYKMA